MKLSPCGVDCGGCPYTEKCGGSCEACGGKPFYFAEFAAQMGVDVCPLYDCPVNKKGYSSCAECDELPCQLFYDWKDPGMTDEAHVQSIKERVAALKG